MEFSDSIEIDQAETGIRWYFLVSSDVGRKIMASLPEKARGPFAFKVLSRLFVAESEGIRVSDVPIGLSTMKDRRVTLSVEND